MYARSTEPLKGTKTPHFSSPCPHPPTHPPRQSFKVYQELQFEKESAVGCFRSKGAADQDEFSRLGSIDRGAGGGERRLSERVFSKRALGPQVPFHKSTFLSKVPISERGGDPLLAVCVCVCVCVRVCVRARAELLGEEGWRTRTVVSILPEQGMLILAGLLMCWWEEIKPDQQNLSKETSYLSYRPNSLTLKLSN